MFKKILVCLDGSKFAEKILPHAIGRAQRFNSQVILFRVIRVNIGAYFTHIPGQPPLIMPELADGIIREEEKRAKSYLNSVAAQLRGAGLNVDSVVLPKIAGGTIASTIVTYAVDNEADLIVMATHGYSGWKHLVFGSVVESVIRNSAVPVLAIKPQDIPMQGSISVEESEAVPA